MPTDDTNEVIAELTVLLQGESVQLLSAHQRQTLKAALTALAKSEERAAVRDRANTNFLQGMKEMLETERARAAAWREMAHANQAAWRADQGYGARVKAARARLVELGEIQEVKP